MQPLDSRTWLAVKGKSRDLVCRDLDVTAGMSITRPRRFALEGAASDAGWFLVVGDGRHHRFNQPEVLARLSAGCEVLTCAVDERNLSSAAAGWRDGREVWAVSYEGEDAPGTVVTAGDLPVTVLAIQQAQTEKSRAEDAGDLLLDPLFEIPIEAVRNATGYRPDEPHPAFDGRFVLLESNHPTIAQRVFGG